MERRRMIISIAGINDPECLEYHTTFQLTNELVSEVAREFASSDINRLFLHLFLLPQNTMSLKRKWRHYEKSTNCKLGRNRR